jgi:hypothetical protein
MEMPLAPVAVQAALIVCAVLLLLLQWIGSRQGSPNLAILMRWVRWVFIALMGTSLAVLFDYQAHPLWVVWAAVFLGWFLLETAYTWLAVAALSRSELPLFPRYAENPRGPEWPNEERFIALRAWLRRHGFKQRSSLVARHEDQELMRLSVMDREDGAVRATLLFFPTPRGHETLACSFHSEGEDGTRLLTDNLFVPFGGFYPENWMVERRPRTRSVEKLYQRHLARCDAHAKPLIPLTLEPLDEINRHSGEMERLNRELGFLSEPQDVEDEGRITSAGRVRVWMEIWTLSYLGLARRYC